MTQAARQAPDGFTFAEVLIVLALIAIMAAITVPMIGNTLGNFRLNGDSRALSNTASLARMQAASNFARTRLYVDLSARTFSTQIKLGAAAWASQGPLRYLSPNDNFGFGSVATPPPNTQGIIAQASACLDDASVVVANTACFIFNSRGIPIDTALAPTGAYALYLTDGVSVCAITVSATGIIRLWRTTATATPSWVKQ